MPKPFVSTLALIATVLVSLPHGAQAAPQILGLVATVAPLPMSCADGVCTVEVSGVCLQEHRPAPASGTRYRAAPGTDIALVVTAPNGEARRYAVAPLVEITSLRTFSSVAVSLPERLVTERAGAGARAQLAIGPLASALPLAVPGDASPLNEEEIAAYTGPLRAEAEAAMGGDGATLAATRVLNQMVNRVPADPAVGADRIGPLRDQVLDGRAAIDKPAAKLIGRALATCREKLRIERTPHLRACLANQHDILNSDTTQKVWKRLKPSG